MKIHRDDGLGRLQISSYGDGYIEINQKKYCSGLTLIGQDIVEHANQHAADLSMDTLQTLLTSAPEVILIGTGKCLVFPDRRMLKRVQEAGIGCDVMDSGAACRTYNILTAEGREVAAWILTP